MRSGVLGKDGRQREFSPDKPWHEFEIQHTLVRFSYANTDI